MKIHALATRPHYARHVDSVWRHIHPSLRGEHVDTITVGQTPPEDVVMVGSYDDYLASRGHRCIYVEHGAGQSYPGDGRSFGLKGYHGVEPGPRVVGYISPRAGVAESWGRPAFAAGCPALDDVVGRPYPHAPCVAVTFHWDARRVCPEARSARDHYLPGLRGWIRVLRDQGFEVIGHWHPRQPTARHVWRHLDVEPVQSVDDVFERATVLVADNTSLLYEFAALDRPVLVLNAPWYRRTVHHGLRFWDHVPGWQIDTPDDLVHFDLAHYQSTDPSARLRHDAVGYCYARIGDAGPAAAAWIGQLVVGLEVPELDRDPSLSSGQ